jgi:hypothetical protein
LGGIPREIAKKTQIIIHQNLSANEKFDLMVTNHVNKYTLLVGDGLDLERDAFRIIQIKALIEMAFCDVIDFSVEDGDNAIKSMIYSYVIENYDKKNDPFLGILSGMIKAGMEEVGDRFGYFTYHGHAIQISNDGMLILNENPSNMYKFVEGSTKKEFY